MASFKFPSPDRQVYVHAYLDTARSTVLHGAVKGAAIQVSPATLSAELLQYVPSAGLQALQGTNVRSELVFATPCILRAQPYALGYYRLLLGISQKAMYDTPATGLRQFKTMEERGVIQKKADSDIPALCSALNEAMNLLIQAIPPGSLQADIDQLPLMMLGAQADGSWRNRIGEKATLEVYEALKSVIISTGHKYTDAGSSLTVVNSSGREVTIALAPDPDVEIRERLGAVDHLRAAIEIKGGMDYANVHNRAGEAEKSHQKAKGRGAGAFWTIISLDRADMKMLKAESPTTQHWFDVREVRSQSGASWNNLVAQVCLAMGI